MVLGGCRSFLLLVTTLKIAVLPNPCMTYSQTFLDSKPLDHFIFGLETIATFFVILGEETSYYAPEQKNVQLPYTTSSSC